MTDTITIPRWLFDELCERAGPPTRIKSNDHYLTCGGCGTLLGEVHADDCPCGDSIEDVKLSRSERLTESLNAGHLKDVASG